MRRQLCSAVLEADVADGEDEEVEGKEVEEGEVEVAWTPLLLAYAPPPPPLGAGGQGGGLARGRRCASLGVG